MRLCRSNPKSQRKRQKRRAPSRSTQKLEFKAFYTSHDSICDYVCASLRDGFNRFSLRRSADFLRKDLATVNRRRASEGFGFIAKSLPSLFLSLLTYLETGISHYPGWKLCPKREYPAFMQQYFAEIYDEKLSETDRANYIDHIYQVCVLFKKLKGPYRNSVLRKQLADFVQTDIELRYLKFKSDSDVASISMSAKNIVTSIVKTLDVDGQTQDFKPKPGPGATNIKVEKHLRYRPHVLYTQLNDEFPYEEWFFSHPWDIVTDTSKHPFKLKRVSENTSRFKFVPKTYGKPRGICIENFETQFLQQAVKNGLVKTLESHPLTKGKINFSDQKINGGLALQSSFTKSLASIDMSEASDRVSRELVSYLFSGNEGLRDKLLALSTKTIEIPDEINFITEFPAAKYAPMGSALCFPVMAIVNFSLIRAIMLSLNATPEHLDSLYVYGDDILFPVEYVEAVYSLLPKFGMKLNENKSYYKSYFRESCGVHAYYGKTITPVYLKYTPTFNMSAKAFVSLLRSEGQLFKKGYFETAELLRVNILKCNKWFKKLPEVTENHSLPGFIREGIEPLTHNSKNLKVMNRRWNVDYLCWEIETLVVTSFQEELPPIAPDEGYLRWFLVDSVTEVGRPEYQFRQSTESHQYVADMLPLKQTHVKGSALGLTIQARWILESAINPLPALRLVTVCADDSVCD